MAKYSNVTPYAETNNFFAKPDLYENIETSYMMRSLKSVSQRKMAQNVRCSVLFNQI